MLGLHFEWAKLSFHVVNHFWSVIAVAGATTSVPAWSRRTTPAVMLLGKRAPPEIYLKLKPTNSGTGRGLASESEIDAIWSAFESAYGSRDRALEASRRNSQVLLPFINRPSTISGAHAVLVQLFGKASALDIITKNPGVLACNPASLAGHHKCRQPREFDRHDASEHQVWHSLPNAPGHRGGRRHSARSVRRWRRLRHCSRMGPPGRPWPFFCAGSLGVDVGLSIHARSTVPVVRVPSAGRFTLAACAVNKSSELKPQALASDMRTDRLMCAGEQSLLGSLL